MDIINTCLATTEPSRILASYSHLLSAGILLAMGIYILVKDRKILNFSFFLFSVYTSIWLFADWVTWVTNNYFLVNVFWAFIDYIDVCMFLVAAYFYFVFINGRDIPNRYKLLITALTLYPLYLTLSVS